MKCILVENKSLRCGVHSSRHFNQKTRVKKNVNPRYNFLQLCTLSYHSRKKAKRKMIKKYHVNSLKPKDTQKMRKSFLLK